MAIDMPSASFMALYIISMHVLHTNSRTSTHWRLNTISGRVEALAAAGKSDTGGTSGSTTSDEEADSASLSSGMAGYDSVMNILLMSSVALGSNGEWKLEAEPPSCYENCDGRMKSDSIAEEKYQYYENKTAREVVSSKASDKSDLSSTTPKQSEKKKKSSFVDCGRPVNSTRFDHLQGIVNRHSHPHMAEPEVAMIFRTKANPDVNMTVLQNQLKKAKKEKPKSSQVYNQIGNYWRIKGDTTRSVECFRKALSLSPNNSDVLLNLARVLFNLQYLDDAYELTKASLAAQPHDQNGWLQHFTLGEILKSRGHYRDAGEHFRRTLDLHPGFHPAMTHLQEIESRSAEETSGESGGTTLTYYTLFIILLLVLGVLCGILTSIDGVFDGDMGEAVKTQRHFNRAMAMRSIKLGINPKLIRMRKQYGC